jgi:pyruvate dehydrogenase E1 component beta subunit
MNYAQSANKALREMLANDRRALVCGQLVRWGTAGLTEGLYEKYPEQVITYPVSEALMNASAMGLSLAGSRVVMIHERMDFVAVGMDALVNHIPIWPRKCGVALPLTIVGIVGKGNGQGAQHSKNFVEWFRQMQGWVTLEPETPKQAYDAFATEHDLPVFIALHRELFTAQHALKKHNIIGLVGAAERYEREFYGE